MVTAVVLAAGGVVYLGLVARYDEGHRRRFPRPAIAWAAVAFVTATVASIVLDEPAERSFAAHMLQHLLIVLMLAPALLLAAPLRLALGTLPNRAARTLSIALGSPAFEAATHPLVGWIAFAIVLWGFHFSPLYERALAFEPLHVAEHAILLGAALLFWTPVVSVAPMQPRLSYPARILYLFLAMPSGTFLGFALYATRHPLYARYTLEDQHMAGVIMWLGGSILMLVAALTVGAAWAQGEDRAFESGHATRPI